MPKKFVKKADVQPIQSLVVSIPEAAVMLGVCGRTVYRLIGSQDIRSVMVGDSRKILRKEIEHYLERNSDPIRKAS